MKNRNSIGVRWKLCVPSKATYVIGPLEDYQIFNLEDDIAGQNDLSAEFPEIIKQLIKDGGGVGKCNNGKQANKYL